MSGWTSGDDDDEFWEMVELCKHTRTPKRRRRVQVFDLDSFGDDCEVLFRFTELEIRMIVRILGFPESISNYGSRVNAEEAFCIFLRRLAYPSRWSDLALIFKRSKESLSHLSAAVQAHLWSFAEKLTILPTEYIQSNVARYCEAITASGAPRARVWGFLDGTVRRVARPKKHQRVLYSGYKKYHGWRFQQVVTPDGLTVQLFGPVPGRKNDLQALQESKLVEELKEINYDDEPCFLYADNGYRRTEGILVAHDPSTPHHGDWNRAMNTARVSIEWSFGGIANIWQSLQMGSQQRASKLPQRYLIAAFLTNCRSCLRQTNEVSQYFQLKPPTIAEYIAFLF